MSGRRLSEMLAAVGVIGSLVFVGQEIRQSNIQARAAAYQEIGIATAREFLDKLQGGTPNIYTGEDREKPHE